MSSTILCPRTAIRNFTMDPQMIHLLWTAQPAQEMMEYRERPCYWECSLYWSQDSSSNWIATGNLRDEIPLICPNRLATETIATLSLRNSIEWTQSQCNPLVITARQSMINQWISYSVYSLFHSASPPMFCGSSFYGSHFIFKYSIFTRHAVFPIVAFSVVHPPSLWLLYCTVWRVVVSLGLPNPPHVKWWQRASVVHLFGWFHIERMDSLTCPTSYIVCTDVNVLMVSFQNEICSLRSYCIHF